MNFNSGKLIIYIILLFIASSAYLFWSSDTYMDPGYKKTWWAVYFDDIKKPSADFYIENYTSQEKYFRWKIMSGKKKIQEGDVKVLPGEKRGVDMNENLLENKKTSVIVSSGAEEKEIHKYANK